MDRLEIGATQLQAYLREGDMEGKATIYADDATLQSPREYPAETPMAISKSISLSAPIWKAV